MNKVSFDVDTIEDMERIHQIAQRAIKFVKGYSLLDADMDVTAVHCNGCPLKLQALLDADDYNFSHDICGIFNTINRQTGKLMNNFLPRFADLKKKKVKS